MKIEADSDDGSSKGSRRITIYDVARQAGVSPSTVSRTFSRPDRVSISTARMVQRVADSLGYHSDMVDSRSDSQGRGLVAVIVPDLGNQFFTGVIRNIQDECERFHFETLILDTRESITRERRIIDAVAPVVSGIILVSPRMPDAMIRKCAQLRPLVSVNRNVRGVSSISIDSSKGACQAVDYLHSLGYRSLTYLDGPAASWSGGIRWRHIFNEGEAKGMNVKRSLPCAPTFYGGYSFAEKYLANPTGAVIAHNDLMAIGLIVALRRLGCECPRDVSVIGFDNDIMSMVSSPPLTTIHMSLSALGRGAADLLIQRLSGAALSAAPTVPARLIIRQSTGKAASVS
ncbi:LacI family DNA-binding transcriptional regulator [uncultured Bifidobacterium sp.]|uniref:LacI family DNA-binding transcriptional regulator n=1 Tax=uncultured Bifidobacterium sp. TaxID=165187 RepID=UPI002596DE94|nr:LacI family DNA-binding transcriptional regulator [uncultured Bifidobacterium sp.]